ncbi:MAG TPA: AAA family ATPase [Solirubrobacterales bacterium]|jgi:DNA-binding CsgD family transcriptional regulator|nr:AAA family ATPase [Solirubrobacterales bacterium]
MRGTSLLSLPGGSLLGRGREILALEELLEGVRDGDGGVLVVHGEGGVGKTALFERAVEGAGGFQTVRTAGVEAEMELPFAAVQQLCSPFLDRMARLPEPQSEALGIALGLRSGSPPDPFLIGLALLGLFAEVAEEQPLICVVDDAQWLDSASARTLAFVARRLLAEKVAMIFATREPGGPLAGLPELRLEPLDRRDSRALLEAVLPAPLDERVLERIVVETRGNPLALLEMPRGLTAAQLAGGFGLPPALPVSTGIEQSFRRRLAGLPEDARRLALVAAADPVGDPALVGRAAASLGVEEAAAVTLESENILAFTPQVAFRHPLVRSAVYRTATSEARREAHAALARATDPDLDPDRRAWHRAQATVAPDEDVAAELEHSAGRAQERGGLAAAAAFLERSVELTPEPSRRAQRALAAAQTKFLAGALDEALDLLKSAEAVAPADDLVRAKSHLLRAQVAFASMRGDPAQLLLAAARELEGHDSTLARATYLEALTATTVAGRLARGGGFVEVSEVALAGPPMPAAPRPSDLLLRGLAVRFTEGYAAGAPLLKEAVRAFRDAPVLPPEEAQWLWYVCWIALFLWDDESWMALSTRQLELARRAGDLSALPYVLANRSAVYAFIGDMRTAARLEDELAVTAEATGIDPAPLGRLTLAALRGREAEFTDLVGSTSRTAEARGEGVALTIAEFLTGALDNGLGRYEAAFDATHSAVEFHEEGQAIWALTELIEASVRTGRMEQARDAFPLVEETTSAAGTDWALGIEARMRALISEGDEAEEHYVEAIDRLRRTSIRVQLARTHLLYGEWLRRRRRRRDAREQLRTAHEFFKDFEMAGFAERARLELEATGESARRRSVDLVDELTPQETQVARLAAEGVTNREIATRLFISTSTVEYHLRKAFRKLDVKSRTQLADRIE